MCQPGCVEHKNVIPADFIYIDTDVYNAYQYVIDKSVVVQEGVFVSVPDILVTNGGYIENHGTIIADKITVCDGCQLEIINTGTIKSEFVGGSNAKITQVVSDKSHLSKIDAGLNSFDVKIMNISNVGKANFTESLLASKHTATTMATVKTNSSVIFIPYTNLYINLTNITIS